MKIAVDVDGVIFDLIGAFLKIFNERYNKNYKKEDLDQYEFYRNWEIPRKEIYSIFYEVYESKCSAPLIDLRIPSILNSLNKNHQIDILSARNNKFLDNLIKKLQEKDIIQGIAYYNITLVDEFPIDSKLKHPYDIYIDDNPNLVKRIKDLKESYLFLFTQPWNKTISSLNKNIIRVNNWNEIYDHISNFGIIESRYNIQKLKS